MKKTVLSITLIILSTFAFSQTKPDISQIDDPKSLPVLFQQSAAEYRALCYQAFNLAELRISCINKRDIKRNHLAIITDLDETILDNSYSEANLIMEGKTYTSAAWKKWTNLSAATAVPGAIDFLKYVHDKGIEIYYISNRKTDELASTLKNLQKLGLPNADEAHTLLYSTESPKEVRRQLVMKDHKVVMLLGDNLNDFAEVFEKKTINQRFQSTDDFRKEWGNKFIVLPNPVYGEWENALYNYDFKLSPEEKKATRLQLLKGY
ncbi:5'-nucleotidase, lipoprotein e(P4) family [Pedobacter sp. SD-b]|uniref:5'-nucleotidase, lipoprotein e(P4) family n=1 Tax=Pedobacter segetis TaxID=2793069 RepID=A0ABS1BMC3_9SPHI|nr:5'-nucleotidase, lipoprotein e(P4) family [Pedobacter segetis]MBK0384025.1 5'-nucleotidase, lipoprotein e(P4) family [Pedobacter segetis]